MSESNREELRRELASLHQEFSEVLGQRLSTIEEHWLELTETAWQPSLVQRVHREVHTLSGSSSSFGFVELGRAAHELERSLRAWLEPEARPPNREERRWLSVMVKDLQRAAQREKEAALPEPQPRDCDRRRDRLVYIVDDDVLVTEVLRRQLESFGYRVATFERAHRVIEAVSTERPDALLLDIMLKEGDCAGLELAEKLRKRSNSEAGGEAGAEAGDEAGDEAAMLFMSARADIDARLMAVRSGCDAFLVKPVDVVELVQQLQRLTGARDEPPLRILIVDDDATLSRYYANVLRRAGMRVQVLNEPKKVIEHLEVRLPDLILMDLHMPECSGRELVEVLRQFERYANLPIVYLSSESELDRQLAAMRRGGDDFLTKSLSDEHLVAAVQIRAARSRRLRAQMNRDGLTGLPSHVALTDRLASELQLARTYGAAVSFALLDLDHFRQLNTEYGHALGDAVLQAVAEQCRQVLRECDVAGRFGGDEFGVVMPNCQQQDAVGLIERVRRALSRVGFYPDEERDNAERLSVTFSAGIASAADPIEVEQLIARADQALYRAKAGGGNRVCSAQP